MQPLIRTRSSRIVTGLALVGTMAAAGCTPTDHAGGAIAEPAATLTVSTRTLGGGAALTFARRVSESSANRLRSEVKTSSHRGLGSGSDDAILADVVAGTTDVGEVSIAALERAGARSLSALTEPGLVTTVDAQQRLATGPWGAQALAGLSAAMVRGIAVLPGPVQRLAAPGEPSTDLGDLRDGTFELIADSAAARTFVQALGATVVPDERADALALATTAADLSATTVSTRGVAGTGTLYADLPLWPDPTVLIMNPRVYDGLSVQDRGAVDAAAQRTVSDVAQQRARTEAESLAVMCALGWRVLPAGRVLGEAVRSQMTAAGRAATDPTIGESLSALRQAVGEPATGALPTCPTATARTGDADGVAGELTGTWEAVATREAIDAHEPGVTEEGLVGSWRLVIGGGRMEITDPQGGGFGAVLAASGNVLNVIIDRGTVDQGLGEHWRYHWSVLHNRLTLVSEPEDGMQKGPTSLISQPFTRRS